MSTLANFFSQYMTDLKPLNLKLTDFVEVLILAFLIYEILVWIKNTRAWILLKGFILLMLFILMALIFRFCRIV